MLLALDYDDTFTRDKEFWRDFCLAAVRRGHTVICVTARGEEDRPEVVQDLSGFVEDIICTAGKAKHAAAYAAGYMVSVWIDDQPQWVHGDAWEQAATTLTEIDL